MYLCMYICVCVCNIILNLLLSAVKTKFPFLEIEYFASSSSDIGRRERERERIATTYYIEIYIYSLCYYIEI